MQEKEMSILEKLKNLYTLQLIHTELDEIEVLKGELPLEVKDLEDEISGIETRVNKMGNSIEKQKSEIVNYTTKKAESDVLILKYKKQMDNIRNNKEYESLSKEIEGQELDIQIYDKRITSLKEKIAISEEKLVNSTKELETKIKDLELKKKELEKIIVKTEKKEKQLNKKVVKQEKVVADRLLKAFNKIRGKYRNKLAVATVQRDSCGGCFNTVPPQLQLEVEMTKKIITCEHCGRVLVKDDLLEEVETA